MGRQLLQRQRDVRYQLYFAPGAAHAGLGGAPGSGGIVGRDGPTGESLGDNVANKAVLILKNSILAYPAASANAYGPIQDGMNNLSSDNTPSSFSVERRSINLLLLPLSNNSGPALTMALSIASPAIDAGDCSGSPATDQRGYPRNGNCDLGAFEVQTDVVAPPLAKAASIGRLLSVSGPALASNLTLWSAPDLRRP